jgi:hypothetical protein
MRSLRLNEEQKPEEERHSDEMREIKALRSEIVELKTVLLKRGD